MADLYQRLKEAGVPLDSHESDLYAKATPEAERIFAEAGVREPQTFVSEMDGEIWYDIPYAYTPYWEQRCAGTKS